MTTTIDRIIEVKQLSARRAEVGGLILSVPVASKLRGRIMDHIVEDVTAQQQPALVHVTGMGEDYWRHAALDGGFTQLPPAVLAIVTAGAVDDPDESDDPAPDPAEAAPPPPPVAVKKAPVRQVITTADPAADGDAVTEARRVAAQARQVADPAPRPHTGTASGPIILASTLDPAPSNTVTPAVTAAVTGEPEAPEEEPKKPSLDAFLAGATQPRQQRAQEGWRSWFHLPPGQAELERRADLAAIRRPLKGTSTIVVVNPKGGVGKTTTVVGLAMTIGHARQGGVLAWDNNETVGNLGSRTIRPTFSVVDLTADQDRFAGGAGTIGDLANFVRDQPDGYDVLASADTTTKMQAIDGEAFRWVDQLTDRWYRVKLVDTGNNQLAPNYVAALAAADQLVITTQIAEDSAEGAARLVADLRAAGHGGLVDQAVTVLSGTAVGATKALTNRMSIFFEGHTRSVLTVPFDPALIGGRLVQRHELRKGTLRAWERVAAAVVAGL